jgi:hypothetical protein
MRTRASLVLLLGVLAAPVSAHADPSDVYVDYVRDGELSCGHSRGDLEGVLNDASANEYGDPLTLTRLKLLVRRQLANGCGPGQAAEPAPEADDRQDAAPTPTEHGGDAAAPVEGGSAEATTATTVETIPAATGDPPPPQSTTTTTWEPTVTEESPAPPASTIVAAPYGGDGGGGSAGKVIAGLSAGAAVVAAGGLLARRTLTRQD